MYKQKYTRPGCQQHRGHSTAQPHPHLGAMASGLGSDLLLTQESPVLLCASPAHWMITSIFISERTRESCGGPEGRSLGA